MRILRKLAAVCILVGVTLVFLYTFMFVFPSWVGMMVLGIILGLVMVAGIGWSIDVLTQ